MQKNHYNGQMLDIYGSPEADGLIHHNIREFISGYAVKVPLMTNRLIPQLEQTMRDAYSKSANKYLIP